MTNQIESIEVNSELYFNEKFNLWLNTISSDDVRLVLKECFHVSTESVKANPTICAWDETDPSYGRSSRFDQKIDFGRELCLIFELKVSTEASVGQLKKYLVYLEERKFAQGYVILVSRNELASEKLGYDRLRDAYPNLLFVTWQQFEIRLTTVFEAGSLEGARKQTEDFLYLLTFLTDIRKRSERLVIHPEPSIIDPVKYIKSLKPAQGPKKNGAFLVWQGREQFWNELLAKITEHSGLPSFSAFRFDFYEYLVRWAFHSKRVYLDIYEDKNYEYIYNYFISNIYPHRDQLPSALLADLYYRFLLIREREVLSTQFHQVFFRRFGKVWYIYVVEKNSTITEVPYLKCHELKFD